MEFLNHKIKSVLKKLFHRILKYSFFAYAAILTLNEHISHSTCVMPIENEGSIRHIHAIEDQP